MDIPLEIMKGFSGFLTGSGCGPLFKGGRGHGGGMFVIEESKEAMAEDARTRAAVKAIKARRSRRSRPKIRRVFF